MLSAELPCEKNPLKTLWCALTGVAVGVGKLSKSNSKVVPYSDAYMDVYIYICCVYIYICIYVYQCTHMHMLFIT